MYVRQIQPGQNWGFERFVRQICWFWPRLKSEDYPAEHETQHRSGRVHVRHTRYFLMNWIPGLCATGLYRFLFWYGWYHRRHLHRTRWRQVRGQFRSSRFQTLKPGCYYWNGPWGDRWFGYRQPVLAPVQRYCHASRYRPVHQRHFGCSGSRRGETVGVHQQMLPASFRYLRG